MEPVIGAKVKLGRKVGSGSFDEIYRSISIQSNEEVAIKLMIEGVPAFHTKPPEEVAKMICLEGMRPQLKNKSKSYPPELKELVEECWDSESVARPIFSEIIVRLNKINANCAKQGRPWKDSFKLPWK